MSETTDRRDARYRNYVIGWLSDSVNKTGGDPDELKTLRNTTCNTYQPKNW
jgi:hypothetical protein